MKRYHEELEWTKNKQRIHLRNIHGWPKKPVDCICDVQVGRFRKRHALGCRKAKCKLCHWDKIFKVRSVKDRLREFQYKESLREYKELL